MAGGMADADFREIESLRVLRRFQEDIRLLTGAFFDFVNIDTQHSYYLNARQRFTSFCKLVNSSPSGKQACERCTRDAVARCLKTNKPFVQNTCHLGLVDAYIPLVLHGEVVGIFSTGQFLFSKPTAAKFSAIERKLGNFNLNLSRARRYYLSIPVIRRERMEAIIDLINLVIGYITEAENKILTLKDKSLKDKIKEARKLMESRYSEDISLADVASEIHLSPSHLAHILRENLNTSFTSYINDIRIHWAKFFLSNTNLKIIEVAYRVGFGNISHFNHLFKEKVGLAPLQFKKQQNSTRI